MLHLQRNLTETLTCDEIVHQGCGDAEDAHQEVTDGQIEDEEVDDGAHAAVLHHDEAHQDVPHHAQQEDGQIRQHVADGHVQGVLVIRIVGDAGGVSGHVCAGVRSRCCRGGALRLQPFQPFAGFHSLHFPNQPCDEKLLEAER